MSKILAFTFLFCLCTSYAFAGGNDIQAIGDDNRSSTEKQPLDSYGAMEINGHSPKMLLLESERAFSSGDLPVALSKVKKSLMLDNDDIDAHLLYARIMQEQLSNQTERDPNLFNKCVEEWLGIMRNRYGDEKNMRAHGINPIGDLFSDEERSIPAKTELIKLTGFAPKAFETDAHYLKRVLLPSETTVTAQVVKKGKAQAIPQASAIRTTN